MESLDPRILIIDIETSPNIADVWGLFNQNVSLSQLRESTRVIAFAAKWHGENKAYFYSDFHDGHERMVERAHELLDEADIVVHYNGTSFDIPHLNREFVQAGLLPPATFQQVDLLKTVKKHFRFTSNKLQHVSTELGLEGKVQHSGHELWVRCMAGDPEAWAEMQDYNVQDVFLTEELYDLVLPWITNHPNLALYVDEAQPLCPNCLSDRLHRRGFTVKQKRSYQRFQCQACGRWSTGSRAINAVGVA